MKKLVILTLFLLAVCANSLKMMPPVPGSSVSNQPISSCDWCRALTPLIQERLRSKFEHLQKEKEEEEEEKEVDEKEVDEKEEEDDEHDDDDDDEPVITIPEIMVDPMVPQNNEETLINPVSNSDESRPVTLSEDSLQSMKYFHPVEVRKPRFQGKFKTFNRYSMDKEVMVEDMKEEEMKEEKRHGHGQGHGHGHKHGHGHGHKHGHGHGKGKGKCGEKARQEICQNFGQSKECHEFLTNYGKAIVKKIFRGEENICESLIDITLNRQNAFMCSPEMSILPYNPTEDDLIVPDGSFDLFVSLIKEMIMNSNNNEVVQTTEVVYDGSGNVWQKTQTLISSSESSSWVDVVVMEQVGGNNVEIDQGFGQQVEDECIFNRIKSAIVNEYHEHKTFYLSFFFTFASLYCLLSCCKSRKCCKNKYQQLPQQVPTECCLEKEKAMPPPPAYDPVNNYPGNVVVQIGLVSPTKEKVVQRPI